MSKVKKSKPAKDKKAKAAKKDKVVKKAVKAVKKVEKTKVKKADKVKAKKVDKKEKKSAKVSKKEKPAKVEKKAKKSKRGSALAKIKYKTSPELQALGLAKTIAGTELMSGLWNYINKKKLKDSRPGKGQTINPDKLMAVIFGKKPFTMFQLAGLGGKRDKHLKKVEA